MYDFLPTLYQRSKINNQLAGIACLEGIKCPNIMFQSEYGINMFRGLMSIDIRVWNRLYSLCAKGESPHLRMESTRFRTVITWLFMFTFFQ